MDGHPLVKLIDLGIAKSFGRAGRTLTTTGIFLGKPRYASPEQFGSLPPGKIDGRSDLYSSRHRPLRAAHRGPAVRGRDGRRAAPGPSLPAPAPFAETDPEEKVPADLRSLIFRRSRRSARIDSRTRKSSLARSSPCGSASRRRSVPGTRRSFSGRDTALWKGGDSGYSERPGAARPAVRSVPDPPSDVPGSGPSAGPEDAEGTLAATRAAREAGERASPARGRGGGLSGSPARAPRPSRRSSSSCRTGTRCRSRGPESGASAARSEPTALPLLPTAAAPTEAATLETAEPAVTAPPPPGTGGREELAEGRAGAEKEGARAAAAGSRLSAGGPRSWRRMTSAAPAPGRGTGRLSSNGGTLRAHRRPSIRRPGCSTGSPERRFRPAERRGGGRPESRSFPSHASADRSSRADPNRGGPASGDRPPAATPTSAPAAPRGRRRSRKRFARP